MSEGLQTGSAIRVPNNGSSSKIGESFNIVNDTTNWYLKGTYKFNENNYVGFYGSTNFLVGQTGSDGITQDDVNDEIFGGASASYLFVGNSTFGEVKFGRNSTITDKYGYGTFVWYTASSIKSVYGYKVRSMGFYDKVNNLINYSNNFTVGDGKSISFEAEVSPNPQKGAATLNFQATNPNTWVPESSTNNTGNQDGFYAENTQAIYLAYNSAPLNVKFLYQHANGTADEKNVNFIGTNVSNSTFASDYASPTMYIISANAGFNNFRAYAIYQMNENVSSLGSNSNYLEFDLKYDYITESKSTWSNYIAYIYETGGYQSSYVNNVMGGKKDLGGVYNNDTVTMQKAFLVGTAYIFAKSKLKVFTEVMFDIRSESEIIDYVLVSGSGGNYAAQKLSGNNAYVKQSSNYEHAGPNMTIGFVYSF